MSSLQVWLIGCRDKANYLTMDLGLWGECPSWGSLLGIIACIYASFGENHGKHRTARSTRATEDWTWHLPFTSFERRTAPPLGGRHQFSLHNLSTKMQMFKKKLVNENILSRFWELIHSKGVYAAVLECRHFFIQFLTSWFLTSFYKIDGWKCMKFYI